MPRSTQRWAILILLRYYPKSTKNSQRRRRYVHVLYRWGEKGAYLVHNSKCLNDWLCLLCSLSSSISKSSRGRRSHLRRIWHGLSKHRFNQNLIQCGVLTNIYIFFCGALRLTLALFKGGPPRANRGEEEVRSPWEAQDSPATVVQPRKEDLHEASPRCKAEDTSGYVII